MHNNAGLVKYAQAWLNYTTRYGWGCWGQPLTAVWLDRKAQQYPDHYSPHHLAELRPLIGKAWLTDCVGLIKGYYWGCEPGGLNVKYIAATDVSANGMYARAAIKGPIRSLPERPGICVHMDGHIGVYIGGGWVIESTYGFYGDGVVKTRLAGRGWIHWLECPYIEYKEVEEVATNTGNKPSAWAKDDTQWLINNGIANGDGHGNYDWQKPLTREQFAVLLRNYHDKAKEGTI